MTDEQIGQNAGAYAGNSAKHLQQPYEEYKLRYDAYIAGAHSRNEEIEELQDELKLHRNQWISVEDRLPEKKDGKIRSDVLLVTLGQCWTAAEYHFGDKRWINMLGERETIEPEYWQEVNLPEDILKKYGSVF